MSILVGNAGQKVLKRKLLRDHYKLTNPSLPRKKESEKKAKEAA